MALLVPGRAFGLRVAGSALAAGTSLALLLALSLALTSSPALAVVSPSTDGLDIVTVDTDDPADAVSVTCDVDEASVNGSAALPALACDDVRSVVVDAADGATTVNLGGLSSATFPTLARTTTDVADADADSVTGSEARDIVHADIGDEVSAGLGDDWVEGAGTASGGDGNDTLRDISAQVQGGPGDDLIVGPGAGPYDGGTGFDTVVQDYSAFTPEQTLNLTLTDAFINGVVATSSIEAYDVTASDGLRADTVNSRGYSGRVTFSGRAGADTFLGGPGDDVADLGPGNDVSDPGPGSDLVLAGDGDDTITSRDGFGDVVECGSGTDTVTADRLDVLSGCENVSLPPPETSRIAGPAKVTKGEKPFFTFAASVASATFECQVDSGPFRGCASPLKVRTGRLKPGRHTLTVRAAQPAGNADPSPSVLTFKVKAKKKSHA